MLQGDRIRMTRLAIRMSQRELGAKIGKDQAYVSRLERGTFPGITVETLEALADALGVSADYLLGRKKKEEDEESHAA
jgi:transcriptional regulator with XRE-family HTH domain